MNAKREFCNTNQTHTGKKTLRSIVKWGKRGAFPKQDSILFNCSSWNASLLLRWNNKKPSSPQRNRGYSEVCSSVLQNKHWRENAFLKQEDALLERFTQHGPMWIGFCNINKEHISEEFWDNPAKQSGLLAIWELLAPTLPPPLTSPFQPAPILKWQICN